MEYVVLKTDREDGDLSGSWDHPCWSGVPAVNIANFRPEGSDHRPETSVRVVCNKNGLFAAFFVKDRYVTCRDRGYMGDVCKDSCVEFFVMPKSDKGYMNFEFNCGGAMKCYYITDWRREGDGFGEYIRLPESEGKKIKVFHSMPVAVDPEITEPVDWFLEVYIPFSVIENNVGSLGNIEKSRWRANFYKCGDETSHPHWASWSPVDELNFHLPRCFGTLAFE